MLQSSVGAGPRARPVVELIQKQKSPAVSSRAKIDRVKDGDMYFLRTPYFNS